MDPKMPMEIESNFFINAQQQKINQLMQENIMSQAVIQALKHQLESQQMKESIKEDN